MPGNSHDMKFTTILAASPAGESTTPLFNAVLRKGQDDILSMQHVESVCKSYHHPYSQF